MPKQWGYTDKIRVTLFDRNTIAAELERVTGCPRTLDNAEAYRKAVDEIVARMRNWLQYQALDFVIAGAAAMGFGIVEAERQAKQKYHYKDIDELIEDLRYHATHQTVEDSTRRDMDDMEILTGC